jgi:AcrR family transcriptional regulator
MGINRPSLYAAYGDKEALFCKALDRYADGPAAYAREALKEPPVPSWNDCCAGPLTCSPICTIREDVYGCRARLHAESRPIPSGRN